MCKGKTTMADLEKKCAKKNYFGLLTKEKLLWSSHKRNVQRKTIPVGKRPGVEIHINFRDH